MQLREARDEKGWTLEVLAQKSGVNKSTISRLERGQTLPMHDTVMALEKALGLKRGTLKFEAAA
jgi:transcriptional regulator with XRE-family HTH domain